MRKFAGKIEFNSNKIAEKFWPAGKQSDVVINLHNQFGQPVINGANINAEVIYSMYESGEPIEAIGILYDLTKKTGYRSNFFYNRPAP
jgi:hypothetical protein